MATAMILNSEDINYDWVSYVDNGIEWLFQYAETQATCIIKPNGKAISGSVAIPNTIPSPSRAPLRVVAIADYAFTDCSEITAIRIPAHVAAIGICAFSGCTALQGIEVDDNNEVLCAVAGTLFSRDKRTLLRHPPRKGETYEVPSGLVAIGDYALADCDALTALTLPKNLIAIGEGAFYNCRNLQTLTLPGSVETIGNYAFSDCSQLQSISLPHGITTIQCGTFYNCHKLTAVRIPSSVTSIDYGAFYGCSALVSIALPPSLTTIGDHAFFGCQALSSITIPNGTASIGISAFNACSRLQRFEVAEGNEYYCTADGVLFSRGRQSLVSCPNGKVGVYAIPQGVQEIGYYAFAYCSRLTAIHIPASVSNVAPGAFLNCQSLESFGVSPDNGNYQATDGALYTKNGETLICYPGGKIGTFKISNSVLAIGDYAFCGAKPTDITIPDGVQTIGENAFNGCPALQSVSLPNSIKTICDGAFYGCPSLEKTTIPPGTASIGEDAFSRCSKLNGVYCLQNTGTMEVSDSTFIGIASSATLYVPQGEVKSLRNGESQWWTPFATIKELTTDPQTASLPPLIAKR